MFSVRQAVKVVSGDPFDDETTRAPTARADLRDSAYLPAARTTVI